MSAEERDSQLSALFDGELESEQAELVTRRLLKDPALQATWGRYALVGAVLRKEPLLGAGRGNAEVAARLRLRMANEPALTAAPVSVVQPAPRPSRLAQLAAGVAVAASVAFAVIAVLRVQAPGLPASVPVAAAVVQPAGAGVAVVADSSLHPAALPADTAPPSYTTPRESGSAAGRMGAPLANYVMAHSEATAPVVRLSALMSDSVDPTVDTVEMTEAEIGARR